MQVPFPALAAVAAVTKAPTTAWAADLLQVTVLVLVAAGATMVALTRVPSRQVVMLSIYGLTLSLLFFSVQAPDVTLSEMTVGAVVLPLLLLLTLAKIRSQQE
jgi:energy-converting hydrogenase B subunit D